MWLGLYFELDVLEYILVEGIVVVEFCIEFCYVYNMWFKFEIIDVVVGKICIVNNIEEFK